MRLPTQAGTGKANPSKPEKQGVEQGPTEAMRAKVIAMVANAMRTNNASRDAFACKCVLQLLEDSSSVAFGAGVVKCQGTGYVLYTVLMAYPEQASRSARIPQCKL